MGANADCEKVTDLNTFGALQRYETTT